jgi:hypothetical protein
MKSIKNYLFLFLLPLLGCSTNKLSQVNQDVDNVYVSKAKAKEVTVYFTAPTEPSQRPIERDIRTENERFSDEVNDLPNNNFGIDDFSFASRIYRFNYMSPWRNYYDPFFDFRLDPFYHDYFAYNFHFRNSSWWTFNFNLGPNLFWNNPFRQPWLFSPFNYNRWGNYWGMYSFYNPVAYPPLYGWGWNDGFGVFPNNPRMLRPRPRGIADNIGAGNAIWNDVNGNRSRAERYPSGSNNRPANGDETAAPDRVVLRTVTIKEEKQALIVLKVQVREQNDILLLPKQVRQDHPEVATVITNLDLPDREAVNQ